MKKTLSAIISIFIVMCAVLMLPVSAAEGDPEGYVVVHYQNWDNVYAADAGAYTWNNGSSTTRYVKEAEEDFFGAVVRVPIYVDADDTVGIIYLAGGADDNNDWSSKGSLNINVDVREIKGGTKDQIDIYTFYSGVGSQNADVSGASSGEGSNSVQNFFVADPTKVNVLVAYFDPAESYEENLGVHSWDGWDAASTSGGWGTPAKIFKNAFWTPEGKQGKVGMLQATVNADTKKAGNSGFLVYAGSDADKKHTSFDGTGNTGTGDAGNFYVTNETEAGAVIVCYVGGGAGYVKRSDVDTAANKNINVTYSESVFKFKFAEYEVKNNVASGTYASKPDSLLVSFSSDVELTYEHNFGIIDTEIGYMKPNFATGVTPFAQTTETQTLANYTSTSLPTNAVGRVVVHFQKWDGNYNGITLWNTATGAASNSALAAAGKDDFGAVYEVNVYSGFTTALELKVTNLAAGATALGNATTYSNNVRPLGGTNHFANASTTAPVTVHVYLYEGGGSADGLTGYFITDPKQVNIMVVYYSNAEYEENLGFHIWGMGDLNTPNWGTPRQILSTIGKTSDSKDIKGAMFSAESFDGAGFVLYAPIWGTDPDNGDQQKVVQDNKKTASDTSNYITDLKWLEAGEVRVLYVVNGNAYYGGQDSSIAKEYFAESAFSGDREDYTLTYETIKAHVVGPKYYTAEELLARFGLTKNNSTATINGIQFDESATKTKEFVLLFEGANLLDNTANYVLSYKYTPTGATEQETITIGVNVDSEKPEIEILGETTITINQGTAWDQTLFPLYRATDDRDGVITKSVYVPDGKGSLDPNVAGDYVITLEVVDVWGNVGTKDFTITVAPVSNCQNSSGMLVSLSLLGLALFFIRRRKTL